jgi:hypothetical protein
LKVVPGIRLQVADLYRRKGRVPAGGVVRAALPRVVDGDEARTLGVPVSQEVAVPQEKPGVDLS